MSPALEMTLALLGAGGLGAGALKVIDGVLARRRTPEQRVGDAVGGASQLIELAMKAAGTSVQQMLAELKDVKEEMAVLKDAHEACERQNVALGKQIETLTQMGRARDQRIESLLRQLQDPQSTQPGGSLSGAVIEMADGDVSVSRPARRRKPRP